ncbi:ABC transporter permease [Brevundimonas naejangsanensis]|uniref:ABC transporter permease n=1 Tax=Brevundimonas naejangsanensis TaxID=588932 RepID=A0A494RFZ0_9CAUL|nr:ABC transporter permease [Brevundimonas naejangsanensis]AYG95347.1 ABC transporter permease [Brevundimonas naejangsanensis]
MKRAADFQIGEAEDGQAQLRLSGDWSTTAVGRTGERLKAALGGRPVTALDLDDLGRFDTAGALAVAQAMTRAIPEAAWTARPEAGRLYRMVARLDCMTAEPPRRSAGMTRGFAKVGRGVYDFGAEAMLSLAFLGRLMAAVVTALKHPGRIRWAAWFSQAERTGLDAIPIVVVTNFFIGAVVAFIGVDLLTQFGAGVFAVQLIGVAVFREFAVVITAVLLAGRSASSFAAEIGSMRMNQEVDAMQVMGVDPFQALVIPRLAALLVMLPLLTFLAMLGGLLGGLLVSWSQLNLGPAFFLQRLVEDGYMPTHMMVGLIKAPVFALVVAAIGCRQGMSVAGDVESLGRRVTAAVVQAIFAIILLDAVFALIFIELNI